MCSHLFLSISSLRDSYFLEKLIFYYRLDEGSLPDFTQDIEQKLSAFVSGHREIYPNCDAQKIESLLKEFFAPDTVNVKVVAEEMNLAQFRQLPNTGTETSRTIVHQEKEASMVRLEISLVEDPNGKEISKLAEGDVVMTSISDSRDIAHYLAHLIGGRREGSLLPLPAVVRKVSPALETFEIQVYYAPGIAGEGVIKRGERVKIIEARAPSWWKKIIPWS